MPQLIAPALRDISEIQAAHDRLIAIVLAEVPNPFGGDPNIEAQIKASLDVLCWALGHDHNTTFAANLRAIDEYHAACGLMLCDSGRLQTRRQKEVRQ